MRINNNATPVTNYGPIAAKKNPSFTGAKETALELFNPNRLGNMSRSLFLVTAFTFLLSGRLLKSRDKNEKREALIRDIPTFVVTAFGVPYFEKKISSLIQQKTGFAFLQEAGEKKISKNPTIQKIKDFFNKGAERELASYGQIHDWFVLNKDLHSGVDGLMARLSGLGGNLKKTASTLSADIKEGLKDFSLDNKEFMEKLSQPEHKALKDKITTEFLKTDNAAFKKASWIKTGPKLVGFAVTLGLIGLCIPNLNIFITEAIAKNKRKKMNEALANSPAEKMPSVYDAMKTAHNSSSDKTKQTYASFLGEKR